MNKSIEKILQIKRVTKVVKGGKQLKFQVLLVLGNQKNIIGLGLGKAKTVNLAIAQAQIAAKKAQININTNINIQSIENSKFLSTKLIISKSKKNSGIKASNLIKSMLECIGFEDISVKQYGSNNKLNVAKALFKFLAKYKI